MNRKPPEFCPPKILDQPRSVVVLGVVCLPCQSCEFPMLGMWGRLWHVNQRTHEVGDNAVVSNRLCVPGANEILEQNLHALDPLLQVIELPSSD
eukprot:1949173-Rhodomonas_salina.1